MMGFLVPPPDWRYTVHTAHYDEVIHLPASDRPLWACLYCGSFHPADKMTCPNCGAPRTGPDMRVVADWFAYDLGIDIRL